MKKFLCTYIPAFLWACAFTCLSVELALHLDPFSSWFFATSDIHQGLPNALALHHSVMDLYMHGEAITHSAFSSKELHHFSDVAAVLSYNRWIGWMLFFLMSIVSLLSSQRWVWLKHATTFPCAALLSAGILASQWPIVFRALHPLLFSGNWDYVPGRDIIVSLYPESYLALQAAWITATLILISISAYTLGRWKTPRVTNSIPTDWTKSHLWIICVGLCSAIPLFFIGYQMNEPFDRAHVIFYIVSAAITCVIWYALTSVQKKTALAIISALLISWYGLLSGTHAACRATIVQMDQCAILVDAIENWRREHHNRLPAQLEDLPLKYIPVVTTGSRTTWVYNHSSNQYFIGIRGPLAYHSGYHSRTNMWNIYKHSLWNTPEKPKKRN